MPYGGAFMFPDLSLLALFYRHAGSPVGPVLPATLDDLLATEIGRPGPQRLRVLVLDDDPRRADHSAMLLRQCGHDAGTACDGPSTLRLVAAGCPDVVLIDLHFAGLAGFSLAQQLVGPTATGAAPVVAVSEASPFGQPRRWQEPQTNEICLAPPDASTVARLVLVGEWFATRRRLAPARWRRAARLAPARRLIRPRRPQMLPPAPKVERAGNVTIITFTGSHIREIGNQLSSELDGSTEGLGECHLLLDFSNVERITSEELGTLIGLHKKVQACGGRLTLFNLSAPIYEVFTTMHLHTLLAICRQPGPAPPAAPGGAGEGAGWDDRF